MPRPRRHPADRRRFSDRIVLARPGERVGLGVTIDRAGRDYLDGAAARRRGSPRDARRPVAWRVGWDEGAASA